MKIYAKCPPTKREYLTSGKEYEVLHECDSYFHMIDDVGDMIVETWIDGPHAKGSWERIVRDDATEALTVRDRFAMAALNGMLAHPKRYQPRISASSNWHEAIAEEAYDIADAMMEARKK